MRLADVTPVLQECAQQITLPRYTALDIPKGYKSTDPDYFLPNEATYCILFIRKFPPETTEVLVNFFSDGEGHPMGVLSPPSQVRLPSVSAVCNQNACQAKNG